MCRSSYARAALKSEQAKLTDRFSTNMTESPQIACSRIAQSVHTRRSALAAAMARCRGERHVREIQRQSGDAAALRAMPSMKPSDTWVPHAEAWRDKAAPIRWRNRRLRIVAAGPWAMPSGMR